jgi:hypothetical protein
MELRTVREIKNSALFINSYNGASQELGLDPGEWAYLLFTVQRDGVVIDWNKSLFAAFSWNNTNQGFMFFRRIYDARERK